MHVLEYRYLPDRQQSVLQAVSLLLLHAANAQLQHRLHLLRKESLSPLDHFLALCTDVLDMLVPFLNGGLKLLA